MPRGRLPVPTDLRFEQKIDRTETCWNWTGGLQTIGYGQIIHNGRKTLTHRYALEKHLGRPLTSGMVVMHSCDNRRCVNPAHLKEATQKENVDDMIRKGRARWNKGNPIPPVDETNQL
jgi:hypothetical protein